MKLYDYQQNALDLTEDKDNAAFYQEKNFENRVKKWLREQGCYVIKHYGCGNTRAGVSDLIICANGRFVAVELKAEDGGTLTRNYWRADK